MKFDEWWESTGSGIVKHETDDADGHARMMAKIAWRAAMREAVAEWEKPHGLTDGRRFIDRLRGMAECDSDGRQ